jgi:uncharacterized membrane protein YhdT
MEMSETEVSPRRLFRAVDDAFVLALAASWFTGVDAISTAAVFALVVFVVGAGVRSPSHDEFQDLLRELRLTKWIVGGWIVWSTLTAMEAFLHLPVWYPLSVAAVSLTFFVGMIRMVKRGGMLEKVVPGLWLVAMALLPLPYVSALVGPVERPGYVEALFAGIALSALPLFLGAAAGFLLELADWVRERDTQQT